jgi:hypothetical protein
VIYPNRVDVYDVSEGSLQVKGRSQTLTQYAITVDAGNVDNDGQDEIVVAMDKMNAPYIMDFQNGYFDLKLAEPVPFTYFGKGLASVNLKFARARDVDGDGQNEIIAVGNNNRLMIWKYSAVTGAYELDFIGADLGFMVGGIDAGNIDGVGLNEIVIGNTGVISKNGGPYLGIYAYDPMAQTYILQSKSSIVDNIILGGIEIGDLNGDGKAEVVVALGGGPYLWLHRRQPEDRILVRDLFQLARRASRDPLIGVVAPNAIGRDLQSV